MSSLTGITGLKPGYERAVEQAGGHLSTSTDNVEKWRWKYFSHKHPSIHFQKL